MVKIVPLGRLNEWSNVRAHAALPSFDYAQCKAHACDAHCASLDKDGITARCSLWWMDAPPLAGERLGVIGHFAAIDSAAGTELLEAACRELGAHGCTTAVGPMDGNTWRRYRFITERGAEPLYFLEPDHPEAWPAQWTASGFRPLANYFSALNPDLSQEDPQVTRIGEDLLKRGIRLRQLNSEQFEKELRALYAISARSFPGNFLYTPIREEEFLAQYATVRPRVRPELVLIAEQDGEPIGYIFTIPDWLQQARGGKVDTVIVKTVAVLPERRFAGLGAWLVAQTQIAARTLGYRRAIHALMHESNRSLNLSARYAKPFRRYTLFARPLR